VVGLRIPEQAQAAQVVSMEVQDTPLPGHRQTVTAGRKPKHKDHLIPRPAGPVRRNNARQAVQKT